MDELRDYWIIVDSGNNIIATAETRKGMVTVGDILQTTKQNRVDNGELPDVSVRKVLSTVYFLNTHNHRNPIIGDTND